MTSDQLRQEILEVLPNFTGDITPGDTSLLAHLGPDVKLCVYGEFTYFLCVDSTFYEASVRGCLTKYVETSVAERIQMMRQIHRLEKKLNDPPEFLAVADLAVPEWVYRPAVDAFQTYFGPGIVPRFFGPAAASFGATFTAEISGLHYTWDAVTDEWRCRDSEAGETGSGDSPEEAKQAMLSNLDARVAAGVGERARAAEVLNRVARLEARVKALREGL